MDLDPMRGTTTSHDSVSGLKNNDQSTGAVRLLRPVGLFHGAVGADVSCTVGAEGATEGEADGDVDGA